MPTLSSKLHETLAYADGTYGLAPGVVDDIVAAAGAAEAAQAAADAAVPKSLYVANSMLKADAGDSIIPAALVVPPSTLVGRAASGDIAALTVAQAQALLGTAAAVPKTLYDANTVLKADADDTPSALVIPPSTMLGRAASGGIAALTVAQVQALIGSGGSSSGAVPIYAPPAVPHADDEEFTSAPSGTWVTRGRAGGSVTPITMTVGGVDPYTTYAWPTGRVEYNTRRASWMHIQIPSDETLFMKQPGGGISTNCFLYARIGSLFRGTAQDTSSAFGVGMAADLSGAPDLLNSLYVGLGNNSGLRCWQGRKITAGAELQIGRTNQLYSSEEYEYVGLHKIGTTYHFWAFSEHLGRVWFGSTTFAPTVQWLGFFVGALWSAVVPGTAVHCADFLRRIDTATFPF
jgi:hypothetical protein